MPLFPWLHPPRRLIALFVCLILVPSLLLLAFGWRLIKQRDELARRQLDVRREEAADLVVAALERAVVATEEKLRDRDAARMAAVTEDSIVLLFDDTRFEALPHGRLLYQPLGAPGFAAPDAVFAAGEELEHQAGDPARAVKWFHALRNNPDPSVRAGALVREARNLQKIGAHDDALAAYSAAARIGATAIGEVPTELFARWARCALLEKLGRYGQLRLEALELKELLQDARWKITRPVFERHFQAASTWSRTGEPVAAYRRALSEVAQQIWSARRRDSGAATREIIKTDGFKFTTLTQPNAGRTAVLVAGPLYVHQEWRSTLGIVESHVAGQALKER